MEEGKQLFHVPSVYYYLERYEFLIAPASAFAIGAMRGAQVSGFYGALIGGAAGATIWAAGEILDHYKITDGNCLTPMLYGAGIFRSFQIPYHIGDFLGAAGGLIAKKGHFNYFESLSVPAMTAVVVSQRAKAALPACPYAPIAGAAAGALIGATDEALIYFNITSKHYLSTITTTTLVADLMAPKIGNIIGSVASYSWYTQFLFTHASNLISNIPHPGFVAGIALSAHECTRNETHLSEWKPIALSKDLYNTYARLIPKEELDKKLELFATVSAANQIFLNIVALKILERDQFVTHRIERLDEGAGDRESKWQDIKLGLLHMGACFLPIYALGEFLNSFINNYFERWLYYSIRDQIDKEWLDGETALKLFQNRSADTLVDQRNLDVLQIGSEGVKVLNNAYSASVTGLISFGLMVNNGAFDIFLYAVFYARATTGVSEWLGNMAESYADEIRDVGSEIGKCEKDITRNIKPITQRDGGVQYAFKHLKTLTQKLRDLREQQDSWLNYFQIWSKIKDFINSIFGWFTVSYGISIGDIPFNVRFQLPKANIDVFKLIGFEGDNADKFKIHVAIESLNKLIDNIRNDTKESVYQVEYKASELALEFSNFTIGVQNTTLTHIDALTLPHGIYAVTGQKGCGKSSLFLKVIGLEYDGVLATGKITFHTPRGTEPTVVMIPQVDYIPHGVTLLELIYYPKILPTDPQEFSELYETVVNLIIEINFDGLPKDHPNSFTRKLNSTENWQDVLSGGQKKAVFIMSAVSSIGSDKECVLVLDETFNGLDAKSIEHAQQFLKEHLPQCSIFVVDHHAAANNNTGFYSDALYVDSHGVSHINLAGLAQPDECCPCVPKVEQVAQS